MSERIIPMKEVVRLTSCSARTIYRLLNNGGFPRPVQLSIRRVGWKESEVQAWVSERSAA